MSSSQEDGGANFGVVGITVRLGFKRGGGGRGEEDTIPHGWGLQISS